MELEPLLEKYKWQISFLFLGLILLGFGILGTNFLGREEGIEVLPAEEVASGDLFVDIQGAIEKPGVYQLPAESRVNDLLIAAGGLSSQADRDWVAKNLNLAQKLEDGAKIYIPKKGEAPRSLGEVGQTAGSQIGKINLNTASSSELVELPGIGPTYAQRIIENRPYQTFEDLLKVPGIGPKTLEKIKEKITIY